METLLISEGLLQLYDALKNDKQSKRLMKILDTANSDGQIRDVITKGCERLIELGQKKVAAEINKKTNGIFY